MRFAVNTPLVSVVIPVFNRAGLIAETIGSVKGDYQGSFELIVVDDGSTDGSAEAAKAAIRAAGLEAVGRVLRQPNGGPSSARNTGAEAARGRYLAFLDSDDRWFWWTLRTLSQVLLASDRPMLIFLQNQDFTNPKLLDAVTPGPVQVERFERFTKALEAVLSSGRPMRFGGSWAVDRDVFLTLGGFATEIRGSEDIDLYLRGGGRLDVALIRAPTMIGIRIGAGGNLSEDAVGLRDGLRFMLANERAGRYPPGPFGDPLRARLFAGSAVYVVRAAFATGRIGLAYGVLARHGYAILCHRGIKSFLWITLTPVFALLKPRSFPFRVRPS